MFDYVGRHEDVVPVDRGWGTTHDRISIPAAAVLTELRMYIGPLQISSTSSHIDASL
jgi:hypothetical protein